MAVNEEVVEEVEHESTRDALEAAFDAAETEEAQDVPDNEQEASTTAEEPEGSVDVSAGDANAEADGEPVPGAEKESEEEAPEPAPLGWNATAREHWKGLPKEVRSEISRREADVNVGMRKNSEAAQYGNNFNQLLGKYRHNFAAAGINDFQAVDRVMQTAVGLQSGNPLQKAQQVASIIHEYGIDIEALDSLLAGEAVPPGAQQNSDIQNAVQQAVAPYQQYMQQQQAGQQEQQTQMQYEANTNVDAFAADPKHEFYSDVREDMADLIDLATQQNRRITLTEAYDRAVAGRPELSQLLTSRASAASLIAKKNAASSTTGLPSGSPTTTVQTDSVRGALEAAWDNAGMDAGGRI